MTENVGFFIGEYKLRRTDREVTDAQKMKAILDRCKIVSYAMWDGKNLTQ